MICKQLPDISSDKKHFDKDAPVNNEVLKNSGFNETKFSPTIHPRRHKGRNIIWFKPPFSSDVKTNAGKLFLTLLQKHFLGHQKYYKEFNKNNVKTSYSCMSNMKSFSKNITLIYHQNKPPLLQHSHAVAHNNQNACYIMNAYWKIFSIKQQLHKLLHK